MAQEDMANEDYETFLAERKIADNNHCKYDPFALFILSKS
jgi:hypothetical protein